MLRSKITKIAMIVLCLFSIFTLCGCKKKEETKKPVIVKFGEFDYNGVWLYSYAQNAITSAEAKQILSKNDTNNAKKRKALYSSEIEIAPSAEQLSFILSKYSGCQIESKYYVEGETNQATKVDSIMGTDLKNILAKNEFSPFAQLVAKYLLTFPQLIDTMEELNSDFKESEKALSAPFKNIFSYHTDENGNLVIETKDFSEIPSSVGGGIGTTYRQDTQILYDNENKIRKWQTSLGLYSATPTGTMKQGYILEMEFNWVIKK